MGTRIPRGCRCLWRNAESRRNAEVPRDASRHAAGRADFASQRALYSRPDTQLSMRSRVVASAFRATSAFHPLRRKGGTQRPRKPRGRLDASRSHRIKGGEHNRRIPTSNAKPSGCLCVPPSLVESREAVVSAFALRPPWRSPFRARCPQTAGMRQVLLHAEGGFPGVEMVADKLLGYGGRRGVAKPLQ